MWYSWGNPVICRASVQWSRRSYPWIATTPPLPHMSGMLHARPRPDALLARRVAISPRPHNPQQVTTAGRCPPHRVHLHPVRHTHHGLHHRHLPPASCVPAHRSEGYKGIAHCLVRTQGNVPLPRWRARERRCHNLFRTGNAEPDWQGAPAQHGTPRHHEPECRPEPPKRPSSHMGACMLSTADCVVRGVSTGPAAERNVPPGTQHFQSTWCTEERTEA